MIPIHDCTVWAELESFEEETFAVYYSRVYKKS